MELENQGRSKILFIVNPISGGKEKSGIEKIIAKNIDSKKFSYEVQYSNYCQHATTLAQEAVVKGFNIIVAVGGDGTVNEISKALIDTNVLFGIVPFGSGNGLARFLQIPLNTVKAIQNINNGKPFKMDTIQINDDYFVNMAGAGFDAHISHLFASYGKRGLRTYVNLILKEFRQYEIENYQLVLDDKTINTEAFLVSFANSSQFGNNAHIAPLASINDGLLDVCILKKFPAWKAPQIVFQMYTKRLTKSKYYQLYKTKELEITLPQNIQMHTDGDPVSYNSIVKLKIIPKSLNIIIP